MHTSKLNIKHNRSAEIHWGVHKLTNELVWIDNVERNGYACNCKCACCGSDLKACTQGKIQQHHFKHRGNNGCYYSDEIAEYLKANEILSAFTSIWIPPIEVRIGERPQMIQTATQCSISNLHCSYDSNHYPPLLIAEIDTAPTRIILSFREYYTREDYMEMIEDARENSWDCLEIILPQKDDGIVVTKELLIEYISGINTNKRWIFNSKAHECFVRLKNASTKLPPTHITYGETIEAVYACPLHKREFGGNFYAYRNDCKECAFRLDFHSDCCRCLGESFVKALANLDIPEDIRKEQFSALQRENEVQIRDLRIQTTATKNIRKNAQANIAGSQKNNEFSDSEKAQKHFQQHLCPYCGERLHKNIGKDKINWLCLTQKCSFYVIEDKKTGEVRIMHDGKEIK